MVQLEAPEKKDDEGQSDPQCGKVTPSLDVLPIERQQDGEEIPDKVRTLILRWTKEKFMLIAAFPCDVDSTPENCGRTAR